MSRIHDAVYAPMSPAGLDMEQLLGFAVVFGVLALLAMFFRDF